MPYYRKARYHNTTEVAIWKIEETETFFCEQTGLVSDKKHEQRRLEHLAGRFLLKHLYPDFPLDQVLISAGGKPYLPGNELFFSISHSFPYIAVAIDQHYETGIDIQIMQQKIVRLQHKFLSEREQQICANDLGRLTLAWAAKEAKFKQYGRGAVDFIQHMPINSMEIEGEDAQLTMTFAKEAQMPTVTLGGGLEKDFAWAVTS